HKIWRATFHM
ncbi:glutathionylspermidine synthase preATP-grasp family protein, partial [Vibrio parahaemolyticus AQ3810]